MTDAPPQLIGICVTIEADFDLSVEDVWPDGDAPDVITAEAVVAVLESCGRKERVLRDWSLLDDLPVSVSVVQPNPAWKQNETLTGEPAPPPWLRSNATAWDRAAAGVSVLSQDAPKETQ